MGAGVEPGETPTEELDGEFLLVEIGLVYTCNFEFSPMGGFYVFGDFYYVIGIEIQAYDRKIGFWFCGFFLDRDHILIFIEFRHAIAFGVADLIAENCGFAVVFYIGNGFLQLGGKALSVK